MDIQKVAQLYRQLDKTNLDSLAEIYHSDVVFEDAAHRIEGITSLIHYFTQLYQNIERCQFSVEEQYQSQSTGFLIWTMHLKHPKLSAGKPIEVHGMSHLKFVDSKVIFHRDYFDMGEMVYEHLPLLGGVVRTIKRRLGQ